MPKKRSTEILRRKDKVRAAVALRGVPEGTHGRVIMTNGFDWIRYWVSFDNGVDMGSISRDELVPVRDWDQFLKDRATAAARPAAGGGGSVAAIGGGDAGDAPAGGAIVNGVAVPQLLIDRTRSALTRLGVSR